MGYTRLPSFCSDMLSLWQCTLISHNSHHWRMKDEKERKKNHRELSDLIHSSIIHFLFRSSSFSRPFTRYSFAHPPLPIVFLLQVWIYYLLSIIAFVILLFIDFYDLLEHVYFICFYIFMIFLWCDNVRFFIFIFFVRFDDGYYNYDVLW